MVYRVRNNELYIRALEHCPECVLLFVILIGLTLCCIHIVGRLSRLSVKYASQKLPFSGYYFSKGLHKDNEHYVKSDNYLAPVIIYGIMMAISICTTPITVSFVQDDVIQYMFVHLLIIAVDIGLFLKALAKSSRMGKHQERLCLLEICRVVNNPYASVLVFYDRNDVIYELYEEGDVTVWKLCGYYEAQCYGETISDIERTPTVSEFLQYASLNARTIWFSWVFPIFVLLSGVLLSLVSIHLSIVVACSSLLFLPLSRTRKVYVVSKHHTVEFKDIRPSCRFTFSCIDKYQNVYYYQSDDEKAIDVGVCFDVQAAGRTIKNVIKASDIQKIYHPKEVQSVTVFGPLYAILIAAIPTFCICGWCWVAIVAEVILTLLHLNLIHYIKRGEI